MQEINTIALGGGISLTCVTTNQWKTSLMSVCLPRPLGAEDRTEAALLPSVLRSCCSRYPGRQRVAQQLDTLYGARLEPFAAKRGEAQMIGLMADAVDERFAGGDVPLVQQTAQMLTDILLCPTLPFPSEVLETEAAAACARIRALPNNKRIWVVRRMYQLMCRDEDYRFCELGDADAMQHMTADNLIRAYHAVLDSAPIHLFYCGSMQAQEVADIFRRAFAPLTGRTGIVRPQFSAPSQVKELRFETEEENVSQGKLAIGIRTGITAQDPLYPAMLLFNACFGGTTASRLFLKVREEKSLCYYASSTTDKLKGVMAVTSGIENENEERARDEILRQLSLIRQGDLSAEEIESARQSVLASMNTVNDSPLALENFYQTQAAAGLTATVGDLIRQVRQVTADEIVQAAQLAKPDTVYFLRGTAK